MSPRFTKPKYKKENLKKGLNNKRKAIFNVIANRSDAVKNTY